MQVSRVPRYFLYGEPLREPDDHVLHVETISERSRRYGWKIRPHTHRSLHQILFVLRGGGTAQAEAATVPFHPPALVIVPAGTIHAFVFEPGTRGYVASFGDALMREISRREDGIRRLFDAPSTLELGTAAAQSMDLEQVFEMFLREFGRTATAHAAALEALLALVLANVLRLSLGAGALRHTDGGGQLQLIARYRALVDEWFRKDAALGDYARALNVSESRLREACLRVTGQPPLQLVHARLLLEAKRLLLYTNMKVGEIAYDLGFEDPAYFTRFFSRRTGVSPRQFRARSAQTESLRR